ncbi:MAG: SDR family oxidoreductase [Chloroflexi bacterium]|nr:SDR family oxidoreductase [Chloroflexota bacterium]
MRTLIVGCSSDIGVAIARRLRQQGHSLFGFGRNKPAEQDLVPSFYTLDLRVADEVESACERLRSEVPSLWAIVYNAGVYPLVDLDRYTLQLWDEVNNVNVKAAFIICSHLHSLLEDGGRIVTIASASAHVGSTDVAYATSKAALVGLTKSLALNLAGRGIRVNAVCPGPIETALSHRTPPERKQEFKKRIPLDRYGQPDEVAAAVEFLLAPENGFMTGATIDINGGLHMR